MVNLISELKNISPELLYQKPELTSHDLDIVDLVDIILEVEKKYNVVITDDLPVYAVGDFVSIVEQLTHKLAS